MSFFGFMHVVRSLERHIKTSLAFELYKTAKEVEAQMKAYERATRATLGPPRVVYRNGAEWVVYGSERPWAS